MEHGRGLRGHRRDPAARQDRGARPRLHRPACCRSRGQCTRRCCWGRTRCAGPSASSGEPAGGVPSTRERMSRTCALCRADQDQPDAAAAVGDRGAFGAEEVYAIAELLRRQKGGAAVVMGALCPAHPQRAGRDVPVRRGGLYRRDRCHRHGSEPRCRPGGLCLALEIRRAAPPPADTGRMRTDRRPGRALPARRRIRRDGGLSAFRRRTMARH